MGAKTVKTVKVYTTPTCPFCVMAKEWLRLKAIEYEEKDVIEDMEARREMVEASGQMGVPVIKVDDDVVVGFNQTQLETLLVND